MFGFVGDAVEGVFGGSPLGIGLAVAAAVIAGPRAKPLAKGAIKGYLIATERVRGWAAEASEQVQDIYAEAKYEYESELSVDGTEAPKPARPRRSRARAAGPVAAEQPV